MPEITTLSQIGLSWDEGAANGGSPVIDYRVWYATDPSSYSILDAGVLSTNFVATSLVMGTTYYFKVQSRTIYGFSEYSDPVVILAASKPSQPDAPATYWSHANDEVTVVWTEPVTNGADVTAYTITFRHNDGVSYSTDLTNCDGSLQTHVDNK